MAKTETELHDRRALLTGASGGLGPAIARALAAKGVKLAFCARRIEPLEELAAEIEAGGATAPAVLSADLQDPDEVSSLIARASERVGPLDIVVHNAALDAATGFEVGTDEEIDRLLRVNVEAPLRLTRDVLPGMLERGRGNVVFVSSLSGYGGTAYQATYAASKGALVALSRSLRAEFIDRPVEFSVVAPGSVGGRGIFARAQEAGIEVPKSLKLATPEAVGAAVVTAIERNEPERLVYPGPIRPALALGLLAPRLSERLNERLGVGRMFMPAARRAEAAAEQSPTRAAAPSLP